MRTANEAREVVTVDFLRPMSALAFGCLTTKGLGFAPTSVRVDGRTTALSFGPLDAEQSRALSDLLRAYVAHPGHAGAIAGWVRREG